MPDISFSNTGTGSPDLFVSTGGNCWCAFVLGAEQKTSKTALNFNETLQFPGFYIFAGMAPTISGADFVANIQAYIAQNAPLYFSTGICWLNNPDTAPITGKAATLWMSGGAGSYNLLSTFNYNLGNNFLTVSVSSATVVVADTTNNIFSISVPQVPPLGSAQLACNNDLSANSYANILNNFTIPLTGRGMGKMLFECVFDTNRGMTDFDVEMKYFYPDATSGNIRELSYPFFGDGVTGSFYLVSCSVYPFDLLNTGGLNTYFAFLGKTLSANFSPTDSVLPSGLVTDYGYPLNLPARCNTACSAAGASAAAIMVRRAGLNICCSNNCGSAPSGNIISLP